MAKSCLLKVFIILLVVGFGPNLFGQAISSGNFYHQTYSFKDYNAGLINRSITQNNQGLLFFGNNFGLMKYDGADWECLSIDFKEGIAGLSVLFHGDRVYVGSQGEFGYFEKTALGQLAYVSLIPRLPHEDQEDIEDVWHIWNIGNNIVFYTFEKLFVYNQKNIKAFRLDRFKAEAAALKHKVYLIDTAQTLYSFDGKDFEVEISDPLLRESVLASMLPNGKNSMLLLMRDGILQYDQLAIRPWVPKNDSILSSAKIVTAIKDDAGNLLIGTMNKGLLILDSNGNLLKCIDNTNGLQSRYVHCIFRDAFDNLWLGHNNGISMIDYSIPFSTYGEDIGILGAGLTALKSDSHLYLGTTNGLFVKSGPNKETGSNFTLVPGSNGKVFDLLNYKGKLLMGHEYGVFEILGTDSVRKIAATNGAWKILFDKKFPNNLFVGGNNGLYVMQPDQNKWFRLQGFEETSRVMEFDDEGYLWVTHGLKGIFRIKLREDGKKIQEVKTFEENNVIGSKFHINTFKIDGEVLFAGNTGLFRFDHNQQSFYRYHKFDKVLDQSFHIRELEEDDVGNIYYWSREECGVLSKVKEGIYEKEFRPFNKVLRPVDDMIVEFTALDKNNIFLGANEGFIKYTPPAGIVRQDSFQTIIREVQVFSPYDSVIFKNYADHQLRKNPVIPYDNNSLRFKFSGVFFSDKENLDYQHWIEGFDSGWSPWSGKTEKEYINLPEGTYIFHVRAKNIYEVQSNVVSFEFTISPPWYRSKVAYFFYFVLVVGLLYVAFVALQRRHHNEKKILEEQSVREINKRETELEHVSKKSEDTIMELRNEKLRSEIEYKNKELATSTLHLLNKNALLSEIKTKLLTTAAVRETVGYQKKIQTIVNEIDKSIANDADWEQFEFHFDLVHGDFSRRMRQLHPTLSPQDMKIAAYLRMNLSTKEIAQLLNISLRGVEKARYRLRKKLDLERQTNLTEFIMNF